MILTNLNRLDKFGASQYARAIGFHPNLLERKLHFFYALCSQKVDGTYEITSEYTKTFDNTTFVQDVEADMVTLKVDENGDPVMIGTFAFWEKTLGNMFIFPEMQKTLDNIALTL